MAAAESSQKFKSTNFYRIIKSFVSVRNDAYTRRKKYAQMEKEKL